MANTANNSTPEPASAAAPPHPSPAPAHIQPYIPNDNGKYWFQFIPESSLNTNEKYKNWLKLMSSSIRAGWAAHCREEITAEQFNTFASAADTWIKHYDKKFD